MSGLSKSEGLGHGSPAQAGTSSGMESMHESPGPPPLQSAAKVTVKTATKALAKPRRTSETSMTKTVVESTRTPEHPKKSSEPPPTLTSEQSTSPPINPAKSPPDKNNRDNTTTMRSKEGGDISQRINQPNQRSRVCGFCWWCCCSCSS